MKKLFIASAALLALAACGGGGDRAAIVNSCVDEGGMSKESCECMADSAKENLDGDLAIGTLCDQLLELRRGGVKAVLLALSMEQRALGVDTVDPTFLRPVPPHEAEALGLDDHRSHRGRVEVNCEDVDLVGREDANVRRRRPRCE